MVHQIGNWQNDEWYKNDYFANHSICFSRARIWHDCSLFHLRELRCFGFYLPLRHACSGVATLGDGGPDVVGLSPNMFHDFISIRGSIIPYGFHKFIFSPHTVNPSYATACTHGLYFVYFPLYSERTEKKVKKHVKLSLVICMQYENWGKSYRTYNLNFFSFVSFLLKVL